MVHLQLIEKCASIRRERERVPQSFDALEYLPPEKNILAQV